MPIDYQRAAPTGTAVTAYGGGEDPSDVTRLRRQYTDWSTGKRAEIEEQRLSRHYYHGDQWTTEEIGVLKKRKQPIITFNRVNRKIDGVTGTLKKLWQDPKAFPRTPNHDDEAEIATEALRYALDRARWKSVGIEATRNGGREGIGVVQLALEQGDQGDPEIGLIPVDGDCFFYDPRSFRPDFSDARYMGVAKWLDLEVAQELYPEHVDELEGLLSSGGDVESWAQQDRERRWIDIEQKRVRVIEHEYIRKGEWHVCHYSSNVKLAGAPSPFVDDKDKSASSFLAFSAFVDHDGDRYGFCRNMKSPQDEINMRRSKALHQLNTRRLLLRKGAVENVERLRAEAARPDGVLEFNIEGGISFEDGIKRQEWQGQMEMLAEAKSEIENFGPTLVEKGMEKSGRAIALLQQAGLAELGPFIDAWSDWKLRLYRIMWSNIRKYWTAERWIRVTDREEAARFVKINQLVVDEYGQPQIANQLAALDVDIILDEAPDTVTTMQDVFELLESLAAAGIPVPPAVVIEMSGLPASVKKRVIEMLEQAKQADPMQEQAKQIALEQEQSKTMQQKATALDKVASAAQRWAEIGQRPEQDARERENEDRKFQSEREKGAREFAGSSADREAERQRADREFEGRDIDRLMQRDQSEREYQERNLDRLMESDRMQREFEGADADRQMQAEAMRARQAAQQNGGV